jgi:hypothetical protein
MSFYTGVFNTNINPPELNMRSFASHMLRLFPNGSAPIFALTSQTGRSKAKSSTHGYFSKTLQFSSIVINQGGSPPGYTAADTVLAVPSNAGIIEKMVLHNPLTRENMRVVAVNPNGLAITVTRAFGRVAAAAIANTQTLVVIGSAFEEGSARPVNRGLTVIHVPNFTQIFRDAWAVTDTARASYTEMGFSNVAENRRDCMLLHSVSIESAIIFGQPKMDTTGAQPLHATQGIIDAMEQYAPNNTNTAAATTDFAQWVTLVEPAFQYSSDIGDPKSRTLFGGSTAIKVINDIARKSGQVFIQDGQTTFGLNFTKFVFYKGTIYMIEHPILNGIPAMSGLALIVDMPALKLAYMDGRDTKPEEYGGTGKNNANGVDSEGGSLTTELAVELINPQGCAVIYDLKQGVKEP